MKWVFAGAGNMASSLIGGLINSGINPDLVSVVDPNLDACKQAQAAFGVSYAQTLEDKFSTIGEGNVGVVLAVKPHIVETVCRVLTAIIEDRNSHNKVPLHLLVVSVAAGVRASSMQSWLPEETALIRCMPNTPALLGLGATALYANVHCSQTHKQAGQDLLNTAGITIWVDQESALDAVTAVSGSGPAYFFYLIEQMTISGTGLGLDESTARELAIETAFGAASMARTSDKSPATLRENVTSKGGTTAAALNVFNDRELPLIIQEAMQAAHDRAVELGEQLAPD